MPKFRPPVQEPLLPYGVATLPWQFGVTRPFGDMSFPQYGPHDGLDIGNGRRGDPVLAIADGIVYSARFDPEAGGAGIVRIDHGDHWTSGYAHLDQIFVTQFQRILQGQPIGLLGSTGWTSGAHLHFDITYRLIRQDPWPLLSSRGADMALVKADVSGLYGKILIAQVPVRVRRSASTTAEIIVTLPAGSKLIAPATVTGQFVETAAPGNQWYAVWVEESLSTILGYVHDSTVREDVDAVTNAAHVGGYRAAKARAIEAVSKI